MRGWDAILYLESGHVFEGMGFGAQKTQGGEAVFNTALSGYQEVFTDPSYYKQVVVMTYPHLGNTGVNKEDVESKKVYLSGVVAREYCQHPSNWRSTQKLGDYLNDAGVPGISEVDTRLLTEILRDEGAQRSIIFPASERGTMTSAACGKKLMEKVEAMEGLELVSKVSCASPYQFTLEGKSKTDAGTVVVYDYGVKTNIVRSIAQRGYQTWVVPYNFPHQEAMKLKPTAVLLSNGPGDPSTVQGAVEPIQALMGKVPIMAICMGHQLLARALGCKTYKLKFGHHGVNHPVQDQLTGKILITSQNHGFSVKAEDLKMKEIQLSHVSLNDGTVEGFYSERMKFYSVQFHPEAKPGPSDADSIFDTFARGFLK